MPTINGRWTEFYRLFVDFLKGEGPVPVEAMDAVQGLTVLQAALLSQESGSTVEL